MDQQRNCQKDLWLHFLTLILWVVVDFSVGKLIRLEEEWTVRVGLLNLTDGLVGGWKRSNIAVCSVE